LPKETLPFLLGESDNSGSNDCAPQAVWGLFMMPDPYGWIVIDARHS
jgi:hypothetical protein